MGLGAAAWTWGCGRAPLGCAALGAVSVAGEGAGAGTGAEGAEHGGALRLCMGAHQLGPSSAPQQKAEAHRHHHQLAWWRMRQPRLASTCRASGGGRGFQPKKGGGGGSKGEPLLSPEAGDMAERSRQMQMDSTKLLSLLLQAEDLQAAVRQHIDSLAEDFFLITSTYLEMAKKEGSDEVVRQLEGVLRVAMEEKERTLRPEIRLLNQLLRDKTPSERLITMAGYTEHVVPDGYFFSLLNRMLLDVGGARKPQEKLLLQLRLIKREAEEHARASAPR